MTACGGTTDGGTTRGTRKRSAALREATGRDYAEWFAALDDWGAPGRPYQAIAAWLTGTHDVSTWWAQKLIVEYEQARGLRDPGARSDGTITVGATRTVAVPSDRLYAAFVDPDVRERWAPGFELTERTSRPGRSARFDVADGTRLSLVVEAVGPSRSRIAVEQQRLPDAATGAAARAGWQARLATLKDLLEADAPP